jgi:hypothetical protein
LHSSSLWGSVRLGFEDLQVSVLTEERRANPIVPAITSDEKSGSYGLRLEAYGSDGRGLELCEERRIYDPKRTPQPHHALG